MVYIECSGGQNKATTTARSTSNIPPPKTKNCYLTNDFDRDKCGSSADTACSGRGGRSSCFPDDHGGYCKHDNKFWVSVGGRFVKLSDEDLLNRYKSDSTDTDQRVGRALKDQERRITNRIRELQIMGKDPVRSKRIGPGDEGKEVHSFVSDMLFKVGMTMSIIIFLVAISFIFIHRKTI